MIRLSRPAGRPAAARLQRRWAGLVAIGATLAAAGPASADPISGAFVAALGLTGTAAAVATAAVTFVLTATANWAISKLTQRGPDTSAQRQASVASLQLGEVPRVAIFGEACTGGSLVQAFNGGGAHGTDWEVQVIALADHECEALTGFLIDDALHEFTGDGAVAGEDGLEIWWRPGTEDQTFPADLRLSAGFDEDDNLAGVAHVWVKYTAEWAQERGGRARFRWIVKGAKLYDPRKDSNVPGGEGDHLWDDPGTWEWSENAKLCQYAYDRGIYACARIDEPDQLLIGRGLSALEAPPERVIAWANLCDEAVALKGGGTEPRYRVGGVIQADQPFVEVAQWFADAMGGHIIQPEGGFDVEPGAAKSVVAEITDDDLLVGRPVRYRDFRSGLAAVNTVLVRYIEPTQNWNEHAAPVRRDLAAVLADGPEEEVLSLPLVTSGTQAQRIAEARLRQRRLERSAEFVLGPRFNWLEEGDWIGWTSARHQAGERVVFRIENHGIDAQRHIALRLEETSAEVSDWTPADDEITPGTAVPDPSSPAGPLTLTDPDAQVVIQGGAPFIRLTWATPVDPAIRTVVGQVRVKGQAQVAVSVTHAPNDGTLDLTNGVAPDTLMQWRIYPLGDPERAYDASEWTDIAVGSLISGGGSVDESAPTTNSPPSYYRALGVGARRERKDRASLSIPGSGTQSGELTTTVLSAILSIPVQQRFVFVPANGEAVVYERGSLTESAWGAWAAGFSENRRPSWVGEVLDRPVELTDGRVASGLNPSGQAALALLLQDQGALAVQDSVRPTQMAVIQGENRILDPRIEDTAYWSLSTPARGVSINTTDAVLGTGGLNAPAAFKVQSDGQSGQLPGSVFMPGYFPVTGGESLYVYQDALKGAGFNGLISVRVYWYRADFSAVPGTTFTTVYTQDHRSSPVGSNTYGALTGVVKAPANAVWAKLYPFVVNWPAASPSAGFLMTTKPYVGPAVSLGTGRVVLNDGVTLATNGLLVTSQGRSAGVNPAGVKRLSNGAEAPMGGQPFKAPVSDAVPVTYDQAFASAPLVTFENNSLDALGAGEYYRLRALDQDGAGFTPDIKIVSPGTGATYTARSDDTPAVVGPAAALERHKGNSGVSADGKYDFIVTWSATVNRYETPGDGFPDNTPTIVRIWVLARRGASDPWTAGGYVDKVLARPTSPGVPQIVYGPTTETIQGDFGQWDTFNIHAGTEWRTAIEVLSTVNVADTATLQAFDAVEWLQQTGGSPPSVRSALSDGRTTNAIITPLDG